MTLGQDAVVADNPVKTKRESKAATVSKKKAQKSKPKKKRVPKQPLVVFAFRLTAAQRNQIHKAAGPGKATQLVRNAAIAAANGDTKALEALTASTKPTK